jgi:phosphohistidine phosphatase
MRLLIIRHAIAVARGTPDIPDDERPLTRRGIRRFQRAAKGLARLVDRPDALLTSPLPRARQTAEIAAKAWGRIRAENAPALAGGAFTDLVTALAPFASATVAVVGHEPDVSSLLGRLIGTPMADRVAFRKGGAAMVEVPGALEDGGVLAWFLSPRALRKMA